MFERHLTQTLTKRYEIARSLYLFGARQVGKTALLTRTFDTLPYRSLEDPDQEQFALQDPKGFLGQFKSTGAILDELQRVPDLFRYLQNFIDTHEVKFVLSGSQNFLMNQHISQSLAGRISLLELMPLSHREKLNQPAHHPLFQNLDSPDTDLYQSILQGGYPIPATNIETLDFWFADYERTYLERDVRLLINVTNLQRFSQFLRMVAARVGSLLNIANLSNELGMSEHSCRQWLTIMEASGIIYRLAPYHKNYNKRLVKSPKIFFNETGLLCYLLNIKRADTIEHHALAGNLFENHVISEIRKHQLNAGKPSPLYFWRDKSGIEIDLLIEHDEQLLLIEIKKSRSFSKNWTANLKKWCEWSGMDLKQCSIIYNGPESRAENETSLINWKAI